MFKRINDRLREAFKGVLTDDDMMKASPEVKDGALFAVAVLLNCRKFALTNMSDDLDEDAEKKAFKNMYRNMKEKVYGNQNNERIKVAPPEAIPGILLAIAKIEFIFNDEVMLSDLPMEEKVQVIKNFRDGSIL